MFDKELKLLRDNEQTLPLYNDGMSALYRSGVFNFLRGFGRVHRAAKATVEEVALDGAYAAGYQDALDMLFNFKEYFLTPPARTATLKPHYGGTNVALLRGDITEKEAHELRRIS